MRFRLTYLGVALALVSLFSCEKEDNETIPVLTMTQTLWPSEGGQQMVSIAATSSWTIEVDYTAGQDADWIHFSPASGEGFATSAMTIDPNNGEGARQATVRLRSPKYEATASVSQSSGLAGKGPQWLELPSLDIEGCAFYTHDMQGGLYQGVAKSGVRNWSFYWDPDNYVSRWVAYPLNNGLIGKGSRSNAWGLDPLLPAEQQPDLRSGSYGGGWTRGHQIPSADRLTYAANVSTFYGTNMTPQDYDFNCYIWADLEGKVRDYASTSDTLYVVTGCDLQGSTLKTGWNSGFQVTVPTAYFKALLRKKGTSYAAVGFYLPHDTFIAGENYMNYILSIDALEEKTGIDFFVNLPVVLGTSAADAIEAADPTQTVKNW